MNENEVLLSETEVVNLLSELTKFHQILKDAKPTIEKSLDVCHQSQKNLIKFNQDIEDCIVNLEAGPMDKETHKYLSDYNSALINFSKAVNTLQSVVREIDHVKGTEYFEVLRAKTGLISVSDDIPRIMEKVLILREICERLKTSEGPTGIVLDRGKRKKSNE